MSTATDTQSRLDTYYGTFTSERVKDVLGMPLALVAAWSATTGPASPTSSPRTAS